MAAIHRFVNDQGVPLVDFTPGQRNDDIAREHLARFTADGKTEGVLLVGRAQGKTSGLLGWLSVLVAGSRWGRRSRGSRGP